MVGASAGGTTVGCSTTGGVSTTGGAVVTDSAFACKSSITNFNGSGLVSTGVSTGVGVTDGDVDSTGTTGGTSGGTSAVGGIGVSLIGGGTVESFVETPKLGVCTSGFVVGVSPKVVSNSSLV